MQIGKIISAIGNTFTKKSNSKQDLTSFGVANNQNMLSNSTAQALKEKYGANVSFDGQYKVAEIYTKNCDVQIDHYRMGTNGNYADIDVRHGDKPPEPSCYRQYLYSSTKQEECYCAKISGEDANEEGCKTAHDAVISAIKYSDDYMQDVSRITKLNNPNVAGKYGTAKIYFADPNERIDHSKVNRNTADYIVETE